MSKGPRDFPGQAFLELLRPPRLATTRFALFASYSADPIVLGGALLHLHARGRDNGSGNKTDFASAIEALRDRVRFIVQRGRIHRGRQLPKIAAVFDQFVVEMPYREQERSWHPKVALICYEGERQHRSWRLWIGSRNLTMSRDLDLGLVLDGETRRRKGSRTIEGIDRLAAELARRAALPGLAPDAIGAELQSVRWMAPEDIEVSDVQLWSDGASPKPPFAPGEKRKLVIFSPFLCDSFVDALAKATDRSRDRTLVTTLPAVRKLTRESKAALGGFKLLSLSAPAPEGEADRDETPSSLPETGDGEESSRPRTADHSGLHAKLYAAIDSGRVDIVAGSANATRRAWGGKNAEAVARFRGGQSQIDGIAAIVGSAFRISPSMLDSLDETEADAAEQRLEQTRCGLAEANFRLRRDRRRFTLHSDSIPSLPADARLEAGLATTGIVPWPGGADRIELGEVPLSLQTELVQFRLFVGELPPACWIQRVEVSPPIDAARDSAAISRLLSVAGLQNWLREMLEREGTAGAEDEWDAEEGSGGVVRPASWKHDGFALEDILSAWARKDLEKLRKVDGMLDRYVVAVLKHGEHLTPKDREDLAALSETWKVAREVLLEKR